MKNIRINFIGTSLNKEARASLPGECHRTVNLQRFNQSLTPVKSQSVFATLNGGNRTIAYIHFCNGAQHFISTDGKTVYHEMDLTQENNKQAFNRKLYSCNDSITSIASINNTLIVNTQSETLYFLHREGKYTSLGPSPVMPIIHLREAKIEVSSEAKDATMLEGIIDVMDEEQKAYINDYYLGTILALRNKIYEKKCFFQPVIVRYALQLFDGSHILPSPPILLNNINHDKLFEEQIVRYLQLPDRDSTMLPYTVIDAGGYGIEYTIESINLNDWSDIIKGIDIFVSNELPILTDKEISIVSFNTNRENERHLKFTLTSPDIKSIGQTATQETLFYRYATISLNEAVINTPTVLENLHKPGDIIYQPLLVVDNSSFSTYGAGCSYVYNSRLHLADIKRTLYPGFPPQLFSNKINTENENALVYTRTRIASEGRATDEVISRSSIAHFDYKLSPLISYPNSQASSIEIVIRHNGYEYRQTFNLESVGNEDRASYTQPNIADIDVSQWPCTEITTENFDDFPLNSSSVTHEFRNRLMVSEVGNPFFFPTELSFNISNGIITGLAAATCALSQGQYGEFPLYVFTNEGIWGMQVGSNEVCYSRSTPINQEIIDSNAVITPIDSSIIYKSGKNISIINGSKCSVLLPLTEFPDNDFNAQLASILANNNAPSLDNTMLTTFFKGDITVGYRHLSKELIFCNKNEPYSIVLDLASKHLYRLDRSYRNIVVGQNTIYGQCNNIELHDLNQEIAANTYVCLVSKPIQLAPDTYTRLRQVSWRMQGADSNIKLCITGSHEPYGENNLLQKASYNGAIKGHIPMRIMATPYKYYRIILYGNVASNFMLDCVDLAFEIVEHNKLR